MTYAEYYYKYKRDGFASDFARRWCSLESYRTYEGSGGNEYTWSLGIFAFALAIVSLPVGIIYGLIVLRRVHRDHVVSERNAFLRVVAGTGLPCCLGICTLALILVVGVMVVRKSVNDVMSPHKALQYAMYTTLLGSAGAGVYACVLAVLVVMDLGEGNRVSACAHVSMPPRAGVTGIRPVQSGGMQICCMT